MCYYTKQSKEAGYLQARFHVDVDPALQITSDRFNGFTFPQIPVITNALPGVVQMYRWGLIPSWTKDLNFRKNTLNARLETITELASFRSCVNNRCLILADGFYEWKWMDEKGKIKQQYLIGLAGDEAFAFAGIYNQWTNRNTGEVLNTFSMVTTAANELMAEIHNTKKRMPIILSPNNERLWLSGENLAAFTHPEVNLVAREV